ncbi:MAG: hypothetical protein IT434_11235 [Phycisphaerales bacterium]|nr:hypothetical protein [Phycisphaerales bacterium]
MSESESKIGGLALDASWGRRRLRAAPRLWRAWALRAALLGTAVLPAVTGCSSAVAHRDRGPVVTDGPTWAGVLASAEPAGWEASRRDAALAPRAGDSDYPLGQWPRPPQPSLHRVRHLSIPRSPNTYLFPREERISERGVTIRR